MQKSYPYYSAVQSLLWGVYGVSQSFINRYLLSVGLTNTQIGILMGVSTGAAFLLQPVLGNLIDGSRLTVRRIVLLCAGLLAASMAGLLLPTSLAVTVSLYAVSYIMLNVIPAFANALGVQGIRAGMRIDIGKARGLGSVTFSITSQVAGWLIAAYGLQTVPVFTLALTLAFLLAVYAFPRVNGDPEKKRKAEDGALAFFRRNPGFILFLVAGVFLNISHAAIRSSMYHIALWKGDINAHGTAMALGALVELPVMFVFTRLLSKKRCDFWLKLCALFFVVRSGMMWLLPGVGGLYAAQLAQGIGSGMYIVGSVYYVALLLKGQDAVRGQWYLGAAGSCAALIAYVSFGTLLDHATVPTLLMATTVLAAVGAVVTFLSVRPVEQTMKTE